MKLLFENNTQIKIALIDSPGSDFLAKCIKHLQHIDIEPRDWDNPFDQSSAENLLKKFAIQLNLPDIDLLKLTDQLYLNSLHEIYEKNYNGNTVWLNFHEQIHRCENAESLQVLNVDWREKSGPLMSNFDLRWLENSSTVIEKSDVYLKWSELGKTPYSYWRDGEPNNFERLCELSKPWITLRPKFHASLQCTNLIENKDVKSFEHWWKEYHDSWCKHWKIPNWTVKDQFSVLKIGKILDIALLENVLKQQIKLKRVLL